MKILILQIFILSLFTSCTTENDKSDSTSRLIALLALNSTSASSTTATTPTCSETKKFTDIQANATYTSCTSCHNTLAHSSGYDFSTYANATNSGGRNQVIPGSPSTSRLWKKVAPGGSMNDRSNTTFNNLIYCWIEKGALQ